MTLRWWVKGTPCSLHNRSNRFTLFCVNWGDFMFDNLYHMITIVNYKNSFYSLA